MILELDTTLLNKLNINLNQLVLLSLVMNTNQKDNQTVHELLSRVNEEEIQDLVNRNIIVVTNMDTTIIYKVSEQTKELIAKMHDSMFDELYNTFPAYVMRPDGTKGFLRSNINKCRREYNRIVGKSRAMHEHIMQCLRYELDDKITTGKIGYMKTMWKWITQHEWECYEDRLNNTENMEEQYGTTVL